MERTTYIKDSEGRFIPTHLVETRAEIKAYLEGYGKGEGSSVPEKYESSKKLRNLYLFGAAVGKNSNTFYTRNGVHYHPRALRRVEPFSGLGRDHTEPSEIELATAHVGEARAKTGYLPSWAFPNFSENLDEAPLDSSERLALWDK